MFSEQLLELVYCLSICVGVIDDTDDVEMRLVAADSSSRPLYFLSGLA